MNDSFYLLREQNPHGTVLFPFMIHQLETDGSLRERVPCHWHEEIEILMVTRGSAQIAVDERSYRIKEGDIIFIGSNSLHSVKEELGAPFYFWAIDFQQAFLNSFVNDVVQQQYIDSVKNHKVIFQEYLSPTEQWERKIQTLLKEIQGVFTQKIQGYELLIKAKLYEIWYLYYAHAEQENREAVEHSYDKVAVAKAVIAYIQEHYNSSISLVELSGAFHVSEGHLCRLFKTVTKMSVIEYINFYRISISAKLLGETRREIGEVAGLVGFNNISYFNKVFRKYMQITPSEFRHNADSR